MTINCEEIPLKLSSPITEEEWDMITDVDFERTEYISFHTKYGKDVHFYKRRTGRWIVDEDGNVKCSVCGNGSSNDNFCERCGAKMEEQQ